MRCNNCGNDISESAIIAWKCNSCGKAFKVTKAQLQNLIVKKMFSPEKSFLKCTTCKSEMDDGNENIVWRCACGTLNKAKLKDFEETEDIHPINSSLINCPNCGMCISSKAKKCVHCGEVLYQKQSTRIVCPDCKKEVPIGMMECPNCGCPIEENLPKAGYKLNRDINMKRIVVPLMVIALLCVIGIVIYNIKIVRPKKIEAQNKEIYEEAVALLEKGKYDEGNELLDHINDYKDVAKIKEEVKYESCAYSAVNAVKDILKNPDSISVYDVKFYNGRLSSKGETEEKSENDRIIDKEHPYIIMHIGAQNGFGGTTESYASCIYYKKDDKYHLDTYTHELNIDELDEDDDDYFMSLLGATIISGYYEDGIEVGTIDMSRFKIVLKNDAYSAIKIIE